MTLGRSPYPGVENRELLEQIEEKGVKLTHTPNHAQYSYKGEALKQ